MALSADLLRGYTDTIILKQLSNSDSYGYRISKAVAEQSGGGLELKEATLYTAFRRLEAAGCIRSYWGDEQSGARRRYYSLTDVGLEAAQGLRNLAGDSSGAGSTVGRGVKMNDTITKIVALLFEDLEETDETVALHDEILQNCQERYADLTAGGMTADEATKAVIDSLNGMQEMLADYPRKNARPAAPQAPVSPMEAEETETAHGEEEDDADERTELYTDVHYTELRLGSADLQVRRSPDKTVRLTFHDPNHVLKAHTEGDRLIVERQANGAKPASSRHIKMDSGFKWNGNLNQLMNSVSKMISGISKELGSMGFSLREEVTLEIPDGLFLQAETSSGDALLEGLTLEELSLRTASGDLTLEDVAVEKSLRLVTKSGDARWSGSAVQAEISSASGNLTLENVRVRDHARLASTSGDVIWNGECDQVELSTTSGDLTLDGLTVRQHARITSTSGDVRWEGQCPETEISSISGDLTVDGPFPALSLNTVSGDVQLRPDGAFQRIALKSTCGSVDVELPENVRPQIRCHTVSGNIDRIPESQPDSASLLDVNTVSGDITIQ